jgi:hypothetical protein
MVEPENQVTQYGSPNEESENEGSLDSYESPSPVNLCALKGNEHRALWTRITFHNNGMQSLETKYSNLYN